MSEWPPLRDYSRSLAVLVGTWDYEFMDRIPAAEHSLRRMEQLLTGPLCGWPQDRLLVLANEPGPGDLPDRLITAFDSISDIALFYFVGHGQISPDDQLCLGLRQSRPEARRRSATSLRFADVRQALLESGAAIRIVILDCCFAGLATTAGVQAGSAGDVLDLTAGTGAYTMAATGAYATAWYQDDPELAEPQTYFTKYLVDLVEEGIPGQASRLQMEVLFQRLRGNLAADKRPVPDRRGLDDAREFAFAYNAAPLQTHRDLERDLTLLTQQLARSQEQAALSAAQLAERDAQIKAFRAEVEGLKAEIARSTPQEKQKLQSALDTAERLIDDTMALAGTATAPLLLPPSADQSGTERPAMQESAQISAAGAEGQQQHVPVTNAAEPEAEHMADEPETGEPVTGQPISLRLSDHRHWRGSKLLVSLLAFAAAAIITLVLVIPSPKPRHSTGEPGKPTSRPTATSTPSTSTVAYIHSLGTVTKAGALFSTLNFSPSGHVLVADGYNSGIFWLLNTSNPADVSVLKEFQENQGQPIPQAFRPDGVLASGNLVGTVTLYRVAGTGEPSIISQPLIGSSNTLQAPDSESLAFSPNGHILASGTETGVIQLWNVSNPADPTMFGQPISFTDSSEFVTSVDFSPDGRTLAASGLNGLTRLWDVSDPAHPKSIGVPLTSASNDEDIGFPAFSPGADILVVLGDSGTLQLWNVADASHPTLMPQSLPSDDGIPPAFSPDGHLLAISNQDGEIQLWNMTNPADPITYGMPLPIPGNPANAGTESAAFSPNGRVLAVDDSEDQIELWSIGSV
jgi:WD40 repeat protein